MCLFWFMTDQLLHTRIKCGCGNKEPKHNDIQPCTAGQLLVQADQEIGQMSEKKATNSMSIPLHA